MRFYRIWRQAFLKSQKLKIFQKINLRILALESDKKKLGFRRIVEVSIHCRIIKKSEILIKNTLELKKEKEKTGNSEKLVISSEK